MPVILFEPKKKIVIGTPDKSTIGQKGIILCRLQERHKKLPWVRGAWTPGSEAVVMTLFG